MIHAEELTRLRCDLKSEINFEVDGLANVCVNNTIDLSDPFNVSNF